MGTRGQPKHHTAPSVPSTLAPGWSRRSVFSVLGASAGAVSLGSGWELTRRREPAGNGPRLPAAGPLTYVAMGASDAVGLGVRTPRRDGWVPVLARELPQPVQLVNLGVPGSTLRQAIDEQLPRAIAAQPDLVTVWLVVNDFLAGVSPVAYAADLDRLLRELRAKTGAVIAIANAPVPPAGLDPWGLPEIARRAVALAWNVPIATAARAHSAVLVDLYGDWPVAEHPEYIGPDGLHPTTGGYRALADVFAATLRSAGVVGGREFTDY